ncbi:hypothetical protein MES4922_190211 [Mesorhizobium ventifaucium]|uniref:Secreted protein n=1 Tax=Mesorhizobium ventifaucium TaxID=666020 RepID=A0ABN8JH90_9HYPH|nr:hypothetical protein MES4922_190211 [Mesorhizobium ventifaucium]
MVARKGCCSTLILRMIAAKIDSDRRGPCAASGAVWPLPHFTSPLPHLRRLFYSVCPVLTRRATHGIPLGHIEAAENKRELARR